MTSEEQTAHFLFVMMSFRGRMLPPLPQNKATIKFSRLKIIVLKLVRKTHHSVLVDVLYTVGAVFYWWDSYEVQMVACYCITRPHCFVNVTSSVFDVISCCHDQCENPH